MAGEFFETTIRVNLVGSFLIAKEAANVMQHNEPNEDGERGLIVSTASIAAFEGQIGQGAYSASKAFDMVFADNDDNLDQSRGLGDNQVGFRRARLYIPMA